MIYLRGWFPLTVTLGVLYFLLWIISGDWVLPIFVALCVALALAPY